MDIIAFSIGGIDVYWYGLVTSLAILAGLLITGLHLYIRRGALVHALDILIYGIPMGLFCARLTYVALHWELYRSQPAEIFAVSHGGLSIYGAGIGFTLTVLVYAYQKGLNFWHWLDVFAPAILLGVAIDQLGHFALQATVGMPVAGDLSANHRIVEYVEYAFRPTGFEGYEYFKPVALYLAIWQFVGFFAVMALSCLQIRRGASAPGSLFLFGMMYAALGRFSFGFLYLSTTPYLHIEQLICLAILLVSAGFMARLKCRPRRGAAPQMFWM